MRLEPAGRPRESRVDEAPRPAPALPSGQSPALVDRLEAPAAGALMAATGLMTATLSLRLSEPGDGQLVPAAVVLALMVAVITGLGIGLRNGRSWTIALCVVLPALLLGMASIVPDVDPTAGAIQETPRPSAVVSMSEAVVFGTGGTGCTVAREEREFAPGDQVRFGVVFDPPVPPGTPMRIRVTKDDALVFNFLRNVGTDTSCYPGSFSTAGLRPGRYLWSLTYDGSGKPPTQVGFDLIGATPTIPVSPPPEPVGPTAAVPASPTPTPMESTVQTISFGTGGTGCAVAHDTRSFAPGAQVRFGVTFDPPLPSGTTMRVLVTRDSESVFDIARTLEAEAACYAGEFSMARLQMGIYRWSLTYHGSRQPPTEESFSLLRQ
jgi:hypothetical protein